MELVQELLYTALIAVLFSFLVAKLVSFAVSGGGADSGSVEGLKDVDEDVVMEELPFGEKMNVGVLESEKRVEFVEEAMEKVDKFEPELHQVDGIVEPVFDDKKIETELVGLQKDSSEEKQEEITKDDLVKEMYENKQVEETVAESGVKNDTIVQSKEINVVGSESKDVLMSDDDDDDEWEGIERSELEKVYGEAVKLVESGNKDDLLSDVQMELYALRKVATEGPCRESQPMALMLSARAKWNAWQKLGNMSPEEAMEHYVALLSKKVPSWMEDNYTGDDKLEPKEVGTPDAVAPDLSACSGHQRDYTHERNLEFKSGDESSDLTGGSSLETEAKE